MGAGGVIVPPAGYHRRTREVCDKYEVLYISDEVVTGFGRLGHFFASEAVFDFVPDVITCAKGISSGYLPLSATILSDQIYDVISVPQSEGALFTHGFTYSGHPVVCAAGAKNIEIMEREDICGHVREVGPYFESQLQSLSEYPIVGDVRGSHFMMCIENVANKATKELFAPDVAIGDRIANHCQKKGLIANAAWPKADPALLVEDEVTLPIQINGKRRDEITVAKDMGKEELEALVLQNNAVIKALDGATPRKLIIVPGRIVNVVI